MPPVTREWFEARKETLAASASAPIAKIWADPLTKKKFGSENTYKAFVNSNKYKDLVKQSGQPAPQPVISMRRGLPAGQTSAFLGLVVLVKCAKSLSLPSSCTLLISLLFLHVWQLPCYQYCICSALDATGGKVISDMIQRLTCHGNIVHRLFFAAP